MGPDAAGMPSGASGGQAPSGGSTSTPVAGETSAGAPVAEAGAPPVGAGGSADDGVIAIDQAAPTGIAVDAQNVYWASAGTILSCPLAGCGDDAPTVVIDNAGEARGIAVDASSVYWMSAPNASNVASIKTCPLSGCLAQPVVLGDVSSMRPNDVHVVGTQLFFTAWPTLGLCTTSDCSQSATLGATPVVSVDTDADYIYYARHGDRVITRCDRDDCANKIDLVTEQMAISVAVDATTLYFAKLAPLGFGIVNDPGIYKCPVAGCGNVAPEVVLAGATAYAIALSPTRLFYTDVAGERVVSIPK